MNKLLITILISLTSLQYIVSQEFPVSNLYLFHASLINPSAVGTDRCRSFSLTTRQNFIGISDAPSTQSFNAHFFRRDRYGLGINVIRDANGLNQNIMLRFSYAFHILLRKSQRYDAGNTYLSIGLSAIASEYFLQEDRFTPVDGDPSVGNSLVFDLAPDADAGLMLYNKKFFAGLSAQQLIPYHIKFYGSSERTRPWYAYAHAGYRFDLSPVSLIEPSFRVKTSGIDTYVDLNCKFLSKNLWSAFSLHNSVKKSITPVSFLSLLGLRIKTGVYLAYGFDAGLTRLQGSHAGCHMLLIEWRLCENGPVSCPSFKHQKMDDIDNFRNYKK